MRKRIGVFMAALIVALGLSAVAASPALAVGDACGGQHICLWQSANPGGYSPDWSIQSPSYSQCINLPGYMNDRVGAMKLTWGWSLTLYEHGGCGGIGIATVWSGGFINCQSGSWYHAHWWDGCYVPGGSSVWFQHPTN